MTQIAELGTQVLTRGRQVKFTPERIQQIKNLVERGKSREEIAELTGVTVGSLQVTCSRLGVIPTLTNIDLPCPASCRHPRLKMRVNQRCA
jgi:copper homeostasis protein CutC